MERFKVCVAVHLILIKDGKILLQRRNNPNKTYYNKLGMPAGHLEINENVNDAIVREMKEELNIDLKDYDLVQIMNLNGSTDVYDSYFFLCKDYEGEIMNNEPDNAKSLEWHDINKPIEDLIDYERYALEKYIENKNNILTVFGWND